MSLNRRRNIFTLGDYGTKEKLKRRQEADPFERDPFKIQSYNFRYAERPTFPVSTLQNRINDSNKANDCQTFFYNYDFPNANINLRKSSVLHNDERVLNLTKFQEYRRKKFLQESTPCRSIDSSKTILLTKPNESKILKVYNNDNQNPRCSTQLQIKPVYMQTPKPSYTITKYENNAQIKCPPPTSPTQTKFLSKTILSPLSDTYVKRARSLNSGCEININIKSLEDKSLQDNVNIIIETDSMCRNLNSGKSQNIFQHNKTNKLNRFYSSETVVVDKNLSKYPLKCQESKQIARKKESDRIKELTSIYSAQVLKKPTTKNNFKSIERVPTFIPTGLNNSFENYQFMKNNFTRSKSLLEKYNSRDYKCNTNNNNTNLQNISYNNLNTSMKKLNAVKQTPSYGSRHSLPATLKRSEFKTNVPLRMNSNAKLPINVNINVYADKLKLLKV